MLRNRSQSLPIRELGGTGRCWMMMMMTHTGKCKNAPEDGVRRSTKWTRSTSGGGELALSAGCIRHFISIAAAEKGQKAAKRQ